MMNFDNITTEKIKNPASFGVLVLFISIIVVIFASQLLYAQTVDLLTENLRQRILTISVTVASNINSKDLEALRVEDDWQKPEWSRIVNRLNKAKYSNEDIVFMYIFRKQQEDPTKMEFVADADSIDPYVNLSVDPSKNIDVNRDGIVEPDGPDKLQWPGQDYPEATDIPETFEAYDAPLTSRDLYTDAYGTVITGYAPIKDELGNTVAVLATDIKADDFFRITRQTLQPFLFFIVFLTLIIIVLALIIIYTWRAYAKSLERLNDQVKVANDRLKELDQMKSEFLGLATHQIRAPLTAIKGYSSMLIEGDFGQIPRRAAESVLVIMKSCQDLINIVNDFLNVSRIEQGRMVYEKTIFELSDLVKEVVNEQKPNIQKAGLSISLEIPSTLSAKVKVDRDKIKQSIGNIIDNAIKYTLSGGITVSISEENKKALIKIKDTGVGIDPHEVGKLFNKFSRTKDANKTNVRGTGIGLYIARKMVVDHGGDIKVFSEGEGKGTTFTIELPKSS